MNKKKPVQKVKTHFEQIPVEIVKKIAKDVDEKHPASVAVESSSIPAKAASDRL
jgi:hypothetical protein